MTRRPPSLHGAPRDGSPASSVLLGRYDALSPSRRTSFPSLGGTATATDVSLPQGTVALAWRPGPLFSRSPPGIGSRRSQGSPRFLGKPHCVHALGGYPGGPSTPGHSAPRVLPSVRPTTSAPRCVVSRGWLPRPAHSLSTLRSDGLPRPHARLASGGSANPCRVGFGPTGSATKGFGFCLLQFPSPLPRLGLAQGNVSTAFDQRRA
jgi:hypothetical protein